MKDVEVASIPPCQAHYLGLPKCTKPGEYDVPTTAQVWADLCVDHLPMFTTEALRESGFHRVKRLPRSLEEVVEAIDESLRNG